MMRSYIYVGTLRYTTLVSFFGRPLWRLSGGFVAVVIVIGVKSCLGFCAELRCGVVPNRDANVVRLLIYASILKYFLQL